MTKFEQYVDLFDDPVERACAGAFRRMFGDDMRQRSPEMLALDLCAYAAAVIMEHDVRIKGNLMNTLNYMAMAVAFSLGTLAGVAEHAIKIKEAAHSAQAIADNDGSLGVSDAEH